MGEGVREAAKESDTFEEYLQRLIDLDEELAFSDDIAPGNTASNPHSFEELYDQTNRFLKDIDRIAETDHHDTVAQFLEDLHRQRLLLDAASVAFGFNLDNYEFLYQYIHRYLWDFHELVENIQRAPNSSATDMEDVIKIYQTWGPICETAIEPVVAVTLFLESEEPDWEKPRKMPLRQQVETVQEFEPLSPLGECLKVDHRNAVAHGGKGGGYLINRMDDVVELSYTRGDTRHTDDVPFDEFRRNTVEALSAVAVLYVLPLHLLSGAMLFLMEGLSTSSIRELEA